MTGLELLIKQMRQASDEGLYFAALVLALTLPDMCGGLAAKNGKGSKSNYVNWLVNHGNHEYSEAVLLYGFRCSFLHQGSMHPHRSEFPLAFIESEGHMHNMSTVSSGGDQVGWISIPMFVDEMASSVESWIADYGNTTTVQNNSKHFVRRRPEGLPPHVLGVAVIA